MSEERRIFITNRIPTLRGEIEERRVRIRIQEENIDTLRSQRRNIFFGADALSRDNLPVIMPSRVSVSEYRGNNRDKNDGRVEEIRDRIKDLAAAHENNITRIDASITTLENSNSTLRGLNNAANSEITSLLSEWFMAHNMSFPHFMEGF